LRIKGRKYKNANHSIEDRTNAGYRQLREEIEKAKVGENWKGTRSRETNLNDGTVGITRGRDAWWRILDWTCRQWGGGKHTPGRRKAAMQFGSAGWSPPFHGVPSPEATRHCMSWRRLLFELGTRRKNQNKTNRLQDYAWSRPHSPSDK
jgi:hypothetical protein